MGIRTVSEMGATLGAEEADIDESFKGLWIVIP